MEHPTFNNGTLMHFDHRVFDITDNSGFGLNFQRLSNTDRPDNRPISNEMGNTYSPFDARMLA